MRRFIQLFACSALFLGSLRTVNAFTLLGAGADWMTERIGYRINMPFVGAGAGAGLGGPMNLGEEYRWNVPTIYYGFSAEFQSYFGARGMEEIDKAVAILNALPPMDTVNVDDFPLRSQRVNFRAQALGLLDVKSEGLSYLIETLGITDPTRFVFTLRNRWIVGTPPQTNYLVIKRNFDPVTWEPTSFINGELWTYTGIAEGETATLAVTEAVDPLALFGLINAPVSSGIPTFSLVNGGFWTGLTRDDIGGLKYIYRTGNYNNESTPPGVSGSGLGAVSTGGSTSPWGIPVITPPAGTTPGGGTTPTAVTNFVVQGPRPGLGGFRFVRVDTVAGAFPSNTVSYTDRVVTNGNQINQTLTRALQVPDIVFDAGDLQQNDTFDQGMQIALFQQSAWITNGGAFGPGHYGPGVIPVSVGPTPSLSFTFNSVGPTYLSGPYPFNLSEATAFLEFRWGSFDGSTNDPVVYPSGASIKELESRIFGPGGGGLGGGTALVDPWAPAETLLVPLTTTGTTQGGGTDTGGGTTP